VLGAGREQVNQPYFWQIPFNYRSVEHQFEIHWRGKLAALDDSLAIMSRLWEDRLRSAVKPVPSYRCIGWYSTVLQMDFAR